MLDDWVDGKSAVLFQKDQSFAMSRKKEATDDGRVVENST